MSVKSLNNIWHSYPKSSAVVVYSLWVVLSFVLASVLVSLLMRPLAPYILSVMSSNVASIVVGAVMYCVLLAILLGAPWLIGRHRVSRRVLGLVWLPTWRDIGLAVVGMVLYSIATVIVVLAITALLPWFNMQEAQNIGIETPHGYEVWLTFLLLVVVAPIVEEVIFRGYLYGKLREKGVPIWLVVIVVSALFGAAHLQWNVAIVVGLMSVFMCLGREITGSIWTGILMHMMKNGLAFYLLFVNTALVAIL